jgi:hypothetical protein
VRKNYEIAGPVRTLLQRKPSRLSASSLSHHRDFDSFDVEFSPDGLVLTEISYRYDGQVLDVTRFEYDAENRAVRSTTEDGKAVVLSTSDFEYQPNSREEVRRDASGLVNRICSDEFDGERPLVLASFLEDGTPVTRKVFEYRGGKLVGSVGTYWGFNGSESHRWITQYDALERIERTYGEKADGTPLGDGKYHYVYGADGRLWKHTYFNEFDDTPISMDVNSYVDDARGNWVQRNCTTVWKNDSRRATKLTTRRITYFD